MGLDAADQRFLDAAEGWLGLGNWSEANEELERISVVVRSHPSVLVVRWEVHAKAKKWDAAVEIARHLSVTLPDDSWGWIHHAYSLHELKQTKEAQEILSSIAHKFPKDSTVRYNLACYACQLGDTDEALIWLVEAFDLDDDVDLPLQALNDPDLKTLWKQIRLIRPK